MKIAVSLLNFRPGKIGGTETYLRRVIPQMQAAAGEHELTLLVDRQQAANNLFPNIPREVVELGGGRILLERGLEAATDYRCRAAEWARERIQPDVVFFPQQSIFPKHVECPTVLVVHDLYHIHLPQNLSPLQRFVRNRGYTAAIDRADHIIAISNYTRDTVIGHYNISPDRVSVVPHGVERPPAVLFAGDEDLTRPYVYFPATTLPHKNHAVLFETVARLKAQGRFPYELVLSGIQTRHWKGLQRQIRRLGLEDTVRHLGYIPYNRVQRLFRAECILFPTMFEGFGLPVYEASEAKKKIIVSRLKIFSELGVPDEFQIDFGDADQLDAALRSPGVTTLRRKPWSWQQTAQATLDVLTEQVAVADRPVAPMRRAVHAATSARRELQEV